ncbi:MAG: two-component system NtrC family sensor kinase [Polaribacter sp.]
MEDFERVFTIEELLPSRSYCRITKALKQMGMNHFSVNNLEGTPLLQYGKDNGLNQIDLSAELEPVGFLRFEPEKFELAESAANFILEVLQTNWRYQMASDIHLQVSKQDYYDLKSKHQQLQESERRYRELSEHLEDKVRAQLNVIEDSQRQLYETEKMASIGQLAAGVAHEINNPIGFVSSNLNTAIDYLQELNQFFSRFLENGTNSTLSDKESSEAEFLLEDFGSLLIESKEGTQRVARIVADLRAFSNVDQSEDAWIKLSDNLSQVARIFLTSVEKKIILETNISPLLPTWCKPAHINQLLLNLLDNAANAITQQGKITLGCEMVNGSILLEVKDTGVGMDEETKRKAFLPFYTTREVGGGTGLGLTVSRDIVLAHNGKITMESQLGQGTTIQVIIPLKDKEPLT